MALKATLVRYQFWIAVAIVVVFHQVAHWLCVAYGIPHFHWQELLAVVTGAALAGIVSGLIGWMKMELEEEAKLQSLRPDRPNGAAPS